MREIVPGILTWPWYSERFGYDFNGYLVRRSDGNLAIDPVEPSADALAELAREGVARILLTASGHSGMDPADHAYLARLIASDTGTPAPDAERKQDISRARSSAVILAFMAGAAALLGAIAAWAAAVTAGRYRDGREPIPYLFDWSSESRARANEQSILHQ